MKTFSFTVFFVLIAGFSATLAAQSVEIADFLAFNGLYAGTLTYTDYGSGDLVSMPLVANVVVGKNKLEFPIEMNEHNDRYQHNFSFNIKDGAIKGWTTIKNELTKGGLLELSRQGKDDNRSAEIRMTLAPTPNGLRISKTVRFLKGEGSDTFMVRNQYDFQRVELSAPLTQYASVAGK
ncbi:MAG: hypothetical protein AAF828_13280 [Bacteroidota bacterium]